jgi:hypothetical protein
MYVKDKNYLTVFSREEINQFLNNIFPDCTDLVSEKRQKQMKEMLKFEMVPPNTLICEEGVSSYPLCQVFVFGNVRVFKRDDPSSAKKTSLRPQRVQEMIQNGEYGRQISMVSHKDM